MLQSAIHNLESTFCNLQSAICMPGHDSSGSSEKKSPTVLTYVINSIDITIIIAIDTIDDMLIIPTRREPTRCGWTINVLPSTRQISNDKTGRRRWANSFFFFSHKKLASSPSGSLLSRSKDKSLAHLNQNLCWLLLHSPT